MSDKDVALYLIDLVRNGIYTKELTKLQKYEVLKISQDWLKMLIEDKEVQLSFFD
jgi:uncharacterized membrane protein (Fun14 family)